MRKSLYVTAALGIVAAMPAAAVNTESYQIPYFGASVGYLITDSVRNSKSGQGLQFSIGVPLDDPRNAIEVRVGDYGYERNFDGEDNFQSGVFVDYVRDFHGGGRSRIRPYGAAGLGFVGEDTFADKHRHFAANVGGGALIPIGFKGWAVRLDGRVQGQTNKESCQPANAPGACEADADFLVDYQITAGLQIPLTIFFDRPVPVRSTEDCPIAVVDPDTGRRDCATDSDRDGVGDAIDQCPGTLSGTKVDREGCPRTPASTDSDNDGVANALDKCAGTQAGLKIDGSGCVIEQRTALAGVTFEADSARLTAQGRSTLDGLAATLAAQPALQVEIAGHTDAVGSDAYNTLLSQQRAEAVRSYLVEKGVDESRLSAVGYGEAEPIAANDTEDGRIANRRVEFRISVAG